MENLTDKQTLFKIDGSQLPKSSFYEKLYQLADQKGLEASKNVQTTPMRIKGGGVYPDGPCGFARVILPDGRKSFARWIIKKGLGTKVNKQGIWIMAKVNTKGLLPQAGQSLLRQEAYAHAFAQILQANGIECHTGSAMD